MSTPRKIVRLGTPADPAGNGFSELQNGEVIDSSQLHVALRALTGLVPGIDKLPYYTGTDSSALTDVSAFGRAALAAADAAAFRALINAEEELLDNFSATEAPTAGDDSSAGYSIGSRWIDIAGKEIYLCVDAAEAAAVWLSVLNRASHAAEADPHAQYVPKSAIGQTNGVAPLDGSGKVSSAFLPQIALTEVHVVASEAEQLALEAQRGDVAVRTDVNTSYVHNGGATATLADWQELRTPTDAVSSVFGRVGNVVATAGDYTAEQVGAEPAGAVDAHAALTKSHGVTGSIVGTGGAQTLTSKTLKQPTLLLKQGTAPTAEGDIRWDATGDKVKVGNGTATLTFSDDSHVLDRANHTGTQPASTISDLGEAIAAAVPTLADTPSINLTYDRDLHTIKADAIFGTTAGTVAEGNHTHTGIGLQYLAEERSTSEPNATVPVHSLFPAGAETDIDLALVAKGNGAIVVRVPDGTATGGNKRGSAAVDLQRFGVIASRVAAAPSSGILSGMNNEIRPTGSCSVICSGSNNIVSSANSFIGGGDGNYVAASAQHSVVGGGVRNGIANDHIHATIPGGSSARSRCVGSFNYAAGKFAIEGDAQIGIYVLRGTTVNSTAGSLTTSNTAPSPSNVVVLPNNSAYAITGNIIARDTATNAVKRWKIEGTAKRGADAAATALVGSPLKSVIGADIGTEAWDCNLVVDTIRGSAEIEVIGVESVSIHWMCRFETVEVS